MMAAEADGEQGLPRSSFTTYMAEGEQLYQKGEYYKAQESFTNALDLQPTEKHCLVARSKCFLKLGDPESALKDAEASLQEDKDFFRGLYQKAEALYAMGDFEFALVFYHRGYRLRPELQEFRLGIQKAQEAIENSVGTPASVRLENKEGMAFLSKQEESKKAKQKAPAKVPKKDQKQQKKVDPSKSQKTARQLLGKLYNDMEYLETLLKDEGLVKGNTRSGLKLQDLILNAITYLDTRTEFWRQQKPIYARERDRRIMQQKWNRERSKPSDRNRYILKSMEEIDQLFSNGNPEGSYKKAHQVLKNIQTWKDDTPNMQELIGNLHSCIGNAHMDMGQMEEALQSHKKDLKIANENNLLEAKSRALDNIGRVYARIGKFKEAVTVWEEKIPLASSSLEKTWLFHEIGRCYLELELLEEARDYGVRSQREAEEAADVEWQLNASVLVAQAQAKLKDYQSAVINFEKALEKARTVDNKDAEQAIISALEDAKRGTTEEVKSEESEKEDSPSEDNE
ncbi:outer dynein arm-docking complex subunit 4 isoform X1 [Hyla sarda]|uniref:outer dynein arm-docking complex subunit 4 isoform X1 n=2 Tax=Hyla sarda TaxID=327740 RepID=UPI0024C35C44|nr:outer dynein arm-docking complex subunit 4 isoform X1 [Hyla sarda]